MLTICTCIQVGRRMMAESQRPSENTSYRPPTRIATASTSSTTTSSTAPPLPPQPSGSPSGVRESRQSHQQPGATSVPRRQTSMRRSASEHDIAARIPQTLPQAENSPASTRVPLSSSPTNRVPSSSTTTTPSQTHGSNAYASPEPSSAGDSPRTESVKVRDLAHVIELVREADLQAARLERHGSRPGSRTARTDDVRYEISQMPVTEVIEMVAALLTKITTTNDLRLTHNGLEKHASDSKSINSSVLAFHGRNVPTITISSYLGRINRYCPTTYEVFLSLLVYFDRMTVSSERNRRLAEEAAQKTGGSVSSDGDSDMSEVPQFVVDSFNIHRLVIAGVTCASKFFSDVFFTNSRYAKVRPTTSRRLNPN